MKIAQFLQQIVWILEKELRYALRDTDVLLYVVLVPLLIYPGTLLVASEVMLWQMNEAQHNLKVFIKDPERLPPHLYKVLLELKGIKLTESNNPDHDLEIGKLDAVVTGKEENNNYNFVTYVGGKKGMLAANKLDEALVSAQLSARREVYKKYRVAKSVLQVCAVNESRLLPFTPTQAKVESFAPLGILAAVVLGFVQVGLTAGVTAVCMLAEEKEKKTFETTLSIPVPGYTLTAGKWGACTLLALLSGGANIIAMGAAAAVVCLQAQSMQKQNLFGPFLSAFGADAWTYTLALLMLVLCAGLGCAVCLLSVSTCRSFKDGQAIVTFPMLFIIALPLLSCIPGIEQNPFMYCLPFTNLLLCLKHPQGNYFCLSLSVLESIAAVVFSLWLSGKLFFSEKAVLGSGGTPLSQRLQQRDSL